MVPANLTAITLTEDAAELSILSGYSANTWSFPVLYEYSVGGQPAATAMFVIGEVETDLQPGSQTVAGTGGPASLFCEQGPDCLGAKFVLDPFNQGDNPVVFVVSEEDNPVLVYSNTVPGVEIQLLVFMNADEGTTADVSVFSNGANFGTVPNGMSVWDLDAGSCGFVVNSLQGDGSLYLVFSIVTF
jgi:hypothetical protein